jgi:hypothetical protein
MTTTIAMSKNEIKMLETVKPFLNDLQTFINTNIIDADVAMTAAKIQEEFFKIHDTGDTRADYFTFGFRVAVRNGDITGIEGVRKAGYRKIGSNSSQVKEPKEHTEPKEETTMLDGSIDVLQGFVDKYIIDETKMTAAQVYAKFKTECDCDLTEDDFIKAFRTLIRLDKITGLESAQRAGYKRATEQTDNDNETEVALDSDKCQIVISERRVLVSEDHRNWKLLLKKSPTSGWVTDGYYGSTDQMLKALSRKLVDDELRNMNGFTIAQLAEKLDEAVSNITGMLSQAMAPKAEVVPVVESVAQEIVAEV